MTTMTRAPHGAANASRLPLEPDADGQELLADALEILWRGVHESTRDLGEQAASAD